MNAILILCFFFFLIFQIVTTEESYSLVIPHAKREHSGTYRLVAVNEAGQHVHNFDVDVEQPIRPV